MKFPAASNAPPSFLSPKSTKSLALTTTDLLLSHLWSWSHLSDWSWPTWRTSLDPCWILFSLPTEPNRSVDDVVNMGLHNILQHLDKPGNYTRILFVDFSLAFNTIMPYRLSDKLTQLSVPTSICQWTPSFLTDRQQLVRLGKLTSRTLTISTGAPQGCVLSPLLFSLYTNDCTSKDPSVKLPKFADDSHWPHQGWRRVCLQTGGWAAGCLVQSQLGSQHAQNSRDDSRVQEEPPIHSPHSPSWTAL